MKLKDLIGHKIIDISDHCQFLIKTDKGIYGLSPFNYPDGGLNCMLVIEESEETWNSYNCEDEK